MDAVRAFLGRREPKPLRCHPSKLVGLSERLVRSHWENNYGGAVKALNAVEQGLAALLDEKDLPPFIYADLKREELVRTGSVILHEHYFDNLAGDGRPLHRRLHAEREVGRGRSASRRGAPTLDGGGMKWVTCRGLRVNRAATSWLVRRFIDPDATFIFVEAEEVAEVQRRDGARGFDAPGATYPHKDEWGRCSFEALASEYRPDDAALQALARIVRCADFRDQIAGTPEAAGLQVISRGFPLVARDDHETVEKAAFLYDALYASLCERVAGSAERKAQS